MSSGCSNRLKLISCGTSPIWRMASLRRVARSMPNTSTLPALRFTSELVIPIRVDLPAPLGPSRAKKSPGMTSSETPLSAWTPLS